MREKNGKLNKRGHQVQLSWTRHKRTPEQLLRNAFGTYHMGSMQFEPQNLK